MNSTTLHDLVEQLDAEMNAWNLNTQPPPRRQLARHEAEMNRIMGAIVTAPIVTADDAMAKLLAVECRSDGFSFVDCEPETDDACAMSRILVQLLRWLKASAGSAPHKGGES
jgi:hypothetical protein